MNTSTIHSIGILVLRLGVAGLMIPHGWSKFMMLANGKAAEFANPIGIGAIPSLGLSAFAELICVAMILVGLFTIPAAAILSINMAVATFFAYQHAPDNVEFAALFFVASLAITLIGAGDYSIDKLLRK